MQYKSPQARLDYRQDWSGWMAQNDVINSSTWVIDGGDGALVIDGDSFDDNSATVYLSSGTAGVTYRVTNKIVTSNGLVARRAWFIKVQDVNA